MASHMKSTFFSILRECFSLWDGVVPIALRAFCHRTPAADVPNEGLTVQEETSAKVVTAAALRKLNDPLKSIREHGTLVQWPYAERGRHLMIHRDAKGAGICWMTMPGGDPLHQESRTEERSRHDDDLCSYLALQLLHQLGFARFPPIDDQETPHAREKQEPLWRQRAACPKLQKRHGDIMVRSAQGQKRQEQQKLGKQCPAIWRCPKCLERSDLQPGIVETGWDGDHERCTRQDRKTPGDVGNQRTLLCADSSGHRKHDTSETQETACPE